MAPIPGAFSTSPSMCWLSPHWDFQWGFSPIRTQHAQLSVPVCLAGQQDPWQKASSPCTLLAQVHLTNLGVRHLEKSLWCVPEGLRYMAASVHSLLVPEWWQVLSLISLSAPLHPYTKHRHLALLFCYAKTVLKTTAAMVLQGMVKAVAREEKEKLAKK